MNRNQQIGTKIWKYSIFFVGIIYLFVFINSADPVN